MGGMIVRGLAVWVQWKMCKSLTFDGILVVHCVTRDDLDR